MPRRCRTCWIVAAFLAAATGARASFVVSPMELRLRAGPGGRAEEPLIVKNTGERPLSVRLYTGDSRFGVDGREENLPVGSHERSCSSWLALDERVIDLAPGEVREIPVLLEIPVGAEGSYWTKIYLEEVSAPEPSLVDRGERTYRVFIKQRVGVRVFEDVEGTLRPAARVTHVSVEPPEIREAAVPAPATQGTGAGGGWRAQILATRNAAKARRLAESLTGVFDGPVHVIFDEPLYKVQAGDEETREKADALRPRLARAGHPSAWIVRAPAAASAAPREAGTAAAPEASPKGMRMEVIPGFRVQLFASSDEGKVLALARRAEQKLKNVVYVERAGGLFKARTGDCATKEEALRLLERAKGSGYGAAWLVPSDVNREVPLLASVEEPADLPPSSAEPLPSASLDPEGERASGAPTVTVRVENTGNAILRCTGRAELRDGGGTAVDTLALGVEGRFTLFPGSTRELRVAGKRELRPGTYTALAIVDFGGDYLVAGDAVFEVPSGSVIAHTGEGAVRGDER